LLPVVIGELAGAIERLTGTADLLHQIDGWLDAHRRGLTR
jgi:hypothetical protein